MHGLTRALLQRDSEVVQVYQVGGTPSAVLVRPDGTIGSPVAGGADAIRRLVARTALPFLYASCMLCSRSPISQKARSGELPYRGTSG
jgi:hypothetical protein